MARTRATRRTITTLLLATTSVTPRPDRLITRRLSAPTTTARTRSTTSSRWSPRSQSRDPVLTCRRAKRKRDFSLRRPTASQERSGKKKSACSARNDGGGGGSFGKRSSQDGAGKDGRPHLLAVGALHFSRAGVTRSGMGIHRDRIILVAMRARQIHQDVEWRGSRLPLRALPGRFLRLVPERLRVLAGPLSGIQEFIRASQHFLRALPHFVLFPSGREGDRNLLAAPIHFQ